jgi:hypothetical protein
MGATPGVSGRIADSPVVELLGYAFNQRFDGVLELCCNGAERICVAFLAGRVDAVSAPTIEAASQREALEAHLPPETLRFAEEHARTQGGDLLTAVETLHLLPPETRHLVRAECVTSQIIALCRLRDDTSYTFLQTESKPAQTGLALSLDPLALIVNCILAEPALERARRSVQAFREEPLTLVQRHEVDPAELRGVSRVCIKRLSVRPHSFSELARLQPSATDEVAALVYALFLTGGVALRSGPSEYPRPMHNSHVPRSISSHGMRAVGVEPAEPPTAGGGAPVGGYSTPAETERVTSSRPSAAPRPNAAPRPGASQRVAGRRQAPSPRASAARPLSPQRPASHLPAPEVDAASVGNEAPMRDSEAVPREDANDRAKVSQECEAEAKVVNAWMMGEADRTFLEKARVFSCKVVKLFPRNPRIRYCYACLEKRAGNYELALREFARVLELEPGNVDAKNDLDQLLRWSKAQRRGEKP